MGRKALFLFVYIIMTIVYCEYEIWVYLCETIKEQTTWKTHQNQ